MFKYYTFDGAIRTIAGRAIRLASPAAFNDPFDTHLDDPLGLDVGDFVQELQVALTEFILGDIEYGHLRDGNFKNLIERMHGAMAQATPERRRGLLEAAITGDARESYDIDRMKQHNREMAAFFIATFSRYGIYCTSAKHDNLLMWSHYADQHKGAVIEFRPNKEKDSVFLASRPVTYSQERPLMYRSAKDMIRRSMLLTLEAATKEIVDSLIYTKASDWNYEEEIRLVIPDYIPEGTEHNLLGFHAEELATVILGCRMPVEQRLALARAASALNPDAAIQVSSMSPRDYGLVFDPYN
jgi:hypothetical protein